MRDVTIKQLIVVRVRENTRDTIIATKKVVQTKLKWEEFALGMVR